MRIIGTYTAIVTPFNRDLSVDHTLLRELAQWQIESGVDGIVPVGTTGESPTLDMSEHTKVVATVVEAVNSKGLVIAGTGANSTAEALRLTSEAKAAGADATLQVTPYYNKPNNEGLYKHFHEISNIGLPVVLYNVPGRTSREIPLSVVARLKDSPNVVAIKEAAGSVERVSAVLEANPNLSVLSGDDSLALPMISVGAQGVISVASNIAPQQVSNLIRLALDNNMVAAREAHKKLYPLFRDLFADTNPIPVKEALAIMGRIKPVFRLPLCSTTSQIRALLQQRLMEQGLLT